MNSAVYESLERKYQTLVNNYQTGKIDEATFAQEVDALQFQDDSDRYWMMGAQTGAWHYYDGQTWHQADPRNADALPFVDEQGRYWQRGSNSGDWYYYQPETDEWVKPAPNDPSIPGVAQGYEQPNAAPYQSHLYPQSTAAGPDMPSQMDGELFQDDEGRYWMMGNKTGQWYFFDNNGWHPAHEFQQQVAQPYTQYQPQPSQYEQAAYASYAAQQPPMQPPQQGYPAQPAYQPQPNPQPAPQSAPQPATQMYAEPPAQQAPAQVDAQPQPQPQPAPQPDPNIESQKTAPTATGQMPNPPSDKSDTGSWFYFDGNQWLKYSSGEPVEADDMPPPDPEMILDQKPESAKAKESKLEEPVVVAELFEDEEDSVEVVDVEVITIIEAEPDIEPEPEPEPISTMPPPAPTTASYAPPPTEEIKPRRTTQPVRRVATETTPAEPKQPAKERPSTEPARPTAPRKREAAHEPTIIIPTESSASSIPSARRSSRPVKPVEPRRARESTIPMEAVPLAGGATQQPPREAQPRQVTQPLPQTPRPKSDTGSVSKKPRTRTDEHKVKRAREDTKNTVPVAKAAAPAAKPEKSGYTLGEILRAFPSTVWTFAGGLIVLLIFAFIIIAAFAMLRDDNLGVSGLAADGSTTPTLAASMADATPTAGPTPEETPAPVAPTEAPTLLTFDSPLGFTLEYPDQWQREEADEYTIFSPSADGLDPANLEDSSLQVGTVTDDSTISEILADTLANFPPDAKILNEGSISIASQTWTSAQIEFDDENLGGRGIATLAITSQDGVGYYLVAVAPADQWNTVQPSFQQIINSFNFGSSQPVVQATPQTTTTAESTAVAEADLDTTVTPEATDEAEDTAASSPAADATPITYIVQPGDTLLAIAVQFGVDSDVLAAKNGIDNPNGLQAGQELIIPLSDEELEDYLAEGGTAGSGSTPADGETSTEEEAATDAETDAEAATETEAAAETPASDSEAAPVGGRIVYPAFNPGTNSYDIWLVDIASGSQSVIAGNASQPAFNKDGNLLAYRSWDLGTRGIFFKDFVGGRGGQVTRFVEDGMPSWAPDGFSFAFMSRREGDRAARLFRGDQLGQNDTPIGFLGEYPTTMPDGRLVVKGCTPSGDCGIFTMGPNGGSEDKISGDGGDTAPSTSPDGSKIAFMSTGRGGRNWEIWVMNVDGSDPQRLTDNGNNDGLPTWSPDGQSIAYASDQGGAWAVWAMNADGSNQRKLFNMNGSPDGIVLHDTNNSRGWLEERISWAP